MKLFKVKQFLMVLALTIGAATFMTSCDDDSDDPIVIDKVALATKIDDAQDLLATTEEGVAEGQYERGSKAILQAVIDNAITINNNEEATQTQVDNTVLALTNAMEAYQAKKIVPIAPDALVGHWTFDDGEGTVVTDHSANNFNGTMNVAPEGWNGGLPEWTTDRYGDVGKALAFNEGSNVKIPYNPALTPGTMTISLWIKADEILESNRFMGLHSWLGYKFQLQGANKPFFTASTTEGIYDKDTDPALELDTWYHLAVTVGDGNMTFYINGTQTQQWEDVPGAMSTESTNDLVFGMGSDVYAPTADNYDEDHIIPLAWGGYFHGSMDEVRIYNTILSSTQIATIYNQEKVPEEK